MPGVSRGPNVNDLHLRYFFDVPAGLYNPWDYVIAHQPYLQRYEPSDRVGSAIGLTIT